MKAFCLLAAAAVTFGASAPSASAASHILQGTRLQVPLRCVIMNVKELWVTTTQASPAGVVYYSATPYSSGQPQITGHFNVPALAANTTIKRGLQESRGCTAYLAPTLLLKAN